MSTESYNLILFVFSAYVLGFIAAMPVGATQLEIARRSLNGFPSSAMMIVAGSVLSDTMYGIIAFYGIAPFLQDKLVVALFWILNAVILIVLGIWAIRESRINIFERKRTLAILRKHNIAFLTGFFLAITNPLMIVWWLLGSRLISEIGIIYKFNSTDNLVFLASGALGIGSYLTMLAFGVFKAKKFFTEQGVRRLTFTFGALLMCLAAYFIFKTAEVIVKV
jgi:threonine/homoserine/homoserine lactone efflux protein